MSLFAGLDIGTSGVRCLIVDEHGTRVSIGERPWTYHTDESGFPQLQLRPAVDEACAEALASVGEVASIGVTSQRTGCVFLGPDGAELYVGPNADGRAIAEGIAQEREHGARIYQIAGRLPAMLYMPARLAWWRANRPDLPVARVRSLSDHVVGMLTGAHATDPSQASELLVFDVARGAYSDELLRALDVRAEALPAVGAPGAPAGEVVDGSFGFAHGTPVVPAGADTQCAALALGAIRTGDAIVVAGTTMLVGLVRADAAIDPSRRLWTSPHVVPGRFVQEAHCGEAGALVAWFATMLGCTPAELAVLAASSAPGASGVVLTDAQPSTASDFALVRQGALTFPTPVLALGGTRADLARAALEGVAFGACAGLGWLDAPQRLFAAGGVASAGAFVEALAGVSEHAVVVATEPASSALGAAIAAAAAHHGGILEAAGAMHDRGREVAPDPDQGYPRHHAAWRERVAALEPMSMRLSQISS